MTEDLEKAIEIAKEMIEWKKEGWVKARYEGWDVGLLAEQFLQLSEAVKVAERIFKKQVNFYSNQGVDDPELEEWLSRWGMK